MKIRIAHNISYLIDEKTSGQNDFAEIFGIKQGSVSSYASGRVKPKLDLIVQIAEYFKISLDDLITGDLQKDSYLAKEPSAIYKVSNQLNETIDNLTEKIKLQQQLLQAKDNNIKALEETVQILKSTNQALTGKAAS
ncbi:helix-turn-helix domain-containing protein [Nonlabens agnitus]|uniref:HTH cro/C1-type domain-containing protein n=1 Tax=Nonlabens agnitus TaxID=870484 RepID=A0A2S9WXD4_9FLAO|nr:helix-turn-helix transcriptional regulator [Nonlabens agnitus]PRP68137.1 hypothetical protein BST86_14080 [Nonlabens agnitus]